VTVRITDLRPDDHLCLEQVARLLVDGFREHAPEAWPDAESARREVGKSLGPGRMSRVALDGDGVAVGWLGGIPQYRGQIWEIHPLVVRPDRQRRGIGRTLVADFEARVRERGGLTIWLGTDDIDGRTSVSGVELYPDVLGHAARLRNLRGHPYEFYARLGFVVTGLMPDANGPGKPDIHMAKRVPC
jgi:aminoglycoside 6'-N-acetyltransferase I